MYRTYFLSGNPDKVVNYKRFSNRLNQVKAASKKAYFSKRFDLCKNNLKATWKLIGTLIKRKPTGSVTPSRIVRNDKIYTDKADISEQFNQYFINVGPQMANTIYIYIFNFIITHAVHITSTNTYNTYTYLQP